MHAVRAEWNCLENHRFPNEQIWGGRLGTDKLGTGTEKDPELDRHCNWDQVIQEQNWRNHDATLEVALKPIVNAAPQAARRKMAQSRTCGSWLTTMPDTINNTELT